MENRWVYMHVFLLLIMSMFIRFLQDIILTCVLKSRRFFLFWHNYPIQVMFSHSKLTLRFGYILWVTHSSFKSKYSLHRFYDIFPCCKYKRSPTLPITSRTSTSLNMITFWQVDPIWPPKDLMLYKATHLANRHLNDRLRGNQGEVYLKATHQHRNTRKKHQAVNPNGP